MPTVCASVPMQAPTTTNLRPSAERMRRSTSWRRQQRVLAFGHRHRTNEMAHPPVDDEEREIGADSLGVHHHRRVEAHLASPAQRRPSAGGPLGLAAQRDRQRERHLHAAVPRGVAVGPDKPGTPPPRHSPWRLRSSQLHRFRVAGGRRVLVGPFGIMDVPGAARAPVEDPGGGVEVPLRASASTPSRPRPPSGGRLVTPNVPSAIAFSSPSSQIRRSSPFASPSTPRARVATIRPARLLSPAARRPRARTARSPAPGPGRTGTACGFPSVIMPMSRIDWSVISPHRLKKASSR